MWFRDSCFTCDGSSTIQVFPLLFNIGMYGDLTQNRDFSRGPRFFWPLKWHDRSEFSFKWVKVIERGRAACSGGGGSLMTHSAGSVTSQRIAFKYVTASEPYRYT